MNDDRPASSFKRPLPADDDDDDDKVDRNDKEDVNDKDDATWQQQSLSWAELKAKARSVRRDLSGLFVSVPGSFTFRNMRRSRQDQQDLQRQRLYFMAATQLGKETALMYVDVGPPQSDRGRGLQEAAKLPWQPLSGDGLASPYHHHQQQQQQQVQHQEQQQQQQQQQQHQQHQQQQKASADPRGGSSSSAMSREEELQLERKRCVSYGVSGYNLHSDSGTVVFSTSGGALYHVVDVDVLDDDVLDDVLDDEGRRPSAKTTAVPREVLGNGRGFAEAAPGAAVVRLNPTLCPCDPDLLAYVSDKDVWVANLQTGQEVQITFSTGGSGGSLLNREDPPPPPAPDRNLPEAATAVFSGLPSYVMQEEFSRFEGFWWRPTTVETDTGSVYSILYERVDESEVDVVKIPNFNYGGETEEHRYPKAGSRNALSSLRCVQFSKCTVSGNIEVVKDVELSQDLQQFFPWAEYLVRAGWTPDGLSLWIQLLDREQLRLAIALVPCTEDRPPSKESLKSTPRTLSSHGTSGKIGGCSSALEVSCTYCGNVSGRYGSCAPVQVIYESKATPDAWINVVDVFTFIPPRASEGACMPDQISMEVEEGCDEGSSSPSTSRKLEHRMVKGGTTSQVSFLIASEETGHRHLYLYTSVVNHISDDASVPIGYKTFLEECVAQKIPLTSGEWSVCGNVWLDQDSSLVFFHGFRDSPLEKHFYAVSMKQPDNIRRLTNLGYSHTVHMSKDCSLMVSVFSSIDNPPASRVFRIINTDNTVDGLNTVAVGWLTMPRNPYKDYSYPELFDHTLSSGEKLYGMIFKPYKMQLGVKYPVVLVVYGGPEVQLISNTFKGMRHMRNHLMASQGFCVVSIDSRGSCNRGTVFESHLKNRMGQVELNDQVEVLSWLASQKSYLDLKRVAIHGWSYGGYLSLMGLVKFPNLFKVCVAGAPVTSWKNYDTAYTERYMSLPEDNQVGYTLGEVLHYAPDFPDEPNRLLIAHGMMDENVHFYQHTAQLIQALIKHGKPYQLQVYPSERHSLRRIEASEHFEASLLHFLLSNL